MSIDIAAVLLKLRPIQDKISKSESESILDRWEFGKLLVAQRGEEKQLPRGLRSHINDQFGLEASEITRRMQLADKFKTEDKLVDACARCGDSWRRMIREELPKNPRKQKPEPSFNELAKTQLAWLRGLARTPERCQEWAALLREELQQLEAAAEVAA